jgi:hypothetical protein
MGDERFLLRQAQAHRGEDGRHLFPQRFDVLLGPGQQDDEIVGLCRVPDYAES